jgi:hypothetical protein
LDEGEGGKCEKSWVRLACAGSTGRLGGEADVAAEAEDRRACLSREPISFGVEFERVGVIILFVS